MTAGPYYSIRTSRSQLDGNEVVMGETMYPKRMEGGFDAGDTRIKQTTMRYRMDTHANITASFNPADMICRGCKNRGPHSVIGGEDQHPVVIVVTDQNFPPVMFSEDEGACIGVVRVEFGSIREIGFIIGDLLDGVRLPDGSVILVSSVSDLDRQGVIGYAEELARTIRIVKEKLGGRVQVSAIPPILIAGINSFKLLRDILEVEFWIERLEGGDGMMLGRMREKMIQKIGERGVGRRRSPEEHQHTLPKGVGVWDKIRIRSVGWPNMPERMEPLTEEDEGELIDMLVRELKMNYGVRVSEKLDHGRDRTVRSGVDEYVVIGASNADRLGDTLISMGKAVVKITKGGWRPTKKGVDEMLEQMGDKISKHAVVVFYGLDNAVFYEENEDGDRMLPKADSDGTYHVKGRVEVASAKQVKNLMHNCGALMKKVKENKKMVLAPGVRYYRCSCCDNLEHCINLGRGGYRRGMLNDLLEIKEAIGNQCREDGHTLYKVASPGELIGLKASMEEEEVEKLLGKDPVHMTKEGYWTLAENLVKMVESRRTLFMGEKRERQDSLEGSFEELGGWRRKKHEWLYQTVSGMGGWKTDKDGQDQAVGQMQQNRAGGSKGGYKGIGIQDGGNRSGLQGGYQGGNQGTYQGGFQGGNRGGYQGGYKGGRTHFKN
jgi:hypothetical protein